MTVPELVAHLPLPAWGRRVAGIGLEVMEHWSRDRCGSLSAALAFYAAFSLAPLLVVAVAVGSVFFGVEAVEGRLYTELESLLGRDAALAAQVLLANAWRAGEARTLGWVSLVATGIGATATFAQLNDALDAIWHAPPAEHAVAALIRIRLISFGLVVGMGFLLVVLLVADAMLLAITDLLFGDGAMSTVLSLIQQAISFGFLVMAFGVLLKVLPDVHVVWGDAWRGGLAGALLFAVGKHVFALYLARAGGTNVFGAASSLAVLMMWLYFSAAVFLLAAEITAHLGRGREAAARTKGEQPWLLL